MESAAIVTDGVLSRLVVIFKRKNTSPNFLFFHHRLQLTDGNDFVLSSFQDCVRLFPFFVICFFFLLFLLRDVRSRPIGGPDFVLLEFDVTQ